MFKIKIKTDVNNSFENFLFSESPYSDEVYKYKRQLKNHCFQIYFIEVEERLTKNKKEKKKLFHKV